MKKSLCIVAAVVALLSNRTVLAADPNQRSARLAEESTAWRVVKYPFRAARTAARTPLILGETLIGRRTVVDEHGFFGKKERDPKVTMRRVAFAGDRPDND